MNEPSAESVGRLQRELEQRSTELSQARAYQAAIGDVLRVISESPADATPVFEAIAGHARALCGARVGCATRFDGEWVHLVAWQGTSMEGEAAARAAFPMKPGPGSINAQAILMRGPVQVADVQRDTDYTRLEVARKSGFRSALAVPMIHEGRAIGSIGVARDEPGAFSPEVVSLLETFAGQAVIAVQNARLFNETRHALERQTASAEVLRVIGRSMADAQPVFDAICAGISRLLPGADLAIGSLGDDGLIHWRAGAGEMRDALRQVFPRPAPRGSGLLTGTATYLPDLMHGEGVPESLREAARTIGRNSSMLSAAMVMGEQVHGTIAACHFDMRPFSEEDGRMIKSFADQAVVAIENARLFNETREALERQTATAEILKVISNSVADATPVFDKILDSCQSLFRADEVILYSLCDRQLALTAYRGPWEETVRRDGKQFPLEGS